VGVAQHAVFAVPTGTSWSLPLYDLALSTAARLRTLGVATAQLTFTTPEQSPLELFGNQASGRVAELLAESGVDLVVNAHARAIEDGELVLVPERRVRADRVVTLPRLAGPRVAGLPHDADGFL